MKKPSALLLAALFACIGPAAGSAAAPSSSSTTSASAAATMSKLAWRNIGPFIGGRVVAIAGVPSRPNLFYFGGVQGGIWRSTDYGLEWTNISDGKLPATATSIGALAVAPSDPDIMYAGTGESDIRGDVDTGDGAFVSRDAGKTWRSIGLQQTHTTSRIVVDPHDPKIVYLASMGHVFAPNAERGVYKSVDGGAHWRKALYVDANTGAIDLAMDPHDPRVLYASMWQAQRVPWKLTSGGPGSALYKSTDAGAHWTPISTHLGFAHGVLGRMGIAVAPSDPRVVYAMVQAHDGGVFRSTNAGATWTRVNAQMKLRQRAFYYMTITVDPTNARIAYAPQVDDVYKTTDGGRTWKTLFKGTYHGDHHSIWLNPRNPKLMLEGDDGGATVSTDGGKTWSSELNQPTGQFYHVALDRQFPYHVYGASQDEGAFGGPSATSAGMVAQSEWRPVASGESTFVAPEPGNGDVTYGSGYYSTMLRLDDATGDGPNVSPWPLYEPGTASSQARYRFGWTHPILFSPADDNELLVAAQCVFSSTDHGRTWKVISPDLTRNDKRTEGPTGGPIDLDQTGAETFPDIASLGVSPRDRNVIWAGSADGLVHVTRDHGGTWQAVTPPALPQWSQITSIEPSRVDTATAYLSASRYMWDDFHPYVYVTHDYGAHWSAMSNGLAHDGYVFVVRQDPREPKLLFAGTRSTVYVSFDGGAAWQPLTRNLPGVQVRDLAIDARQGQLVAATHGRAFWILDDLALLEAVARDGAATSSQVRLFAPEAAWLTHSYGHAGAVPFDAGQNPAYGATVYFNVPAAALAGPVTLTFRDAGGAVVRRFNLHRKPKHDRKIAPEVRYEMDAIHARALDLDAMSAIEPGMNRFDWDLRSTPATEVLGYKAPEAEDYPSTVDGPTVPSGSYTVTLQTAATSVTAPLRVTIDPRLAATADDLAARYALEMRVHDALDTLDRSINEAIRSERTLPAQRRSAVARGVGELVQLDIHSSEGSVLHEPKLRGKLGFLQAELETAFVRPTPAQYAAFDTLQTRVIAGRSRLQQQLAERGSR